MAISLSTLCIYHILYNDFLNILGINCNLIILMTLLITIIISYYLFLRYTKLNHEQQLLNQAIDHFKNDQQNYDFIEKKNLFRDALGLATSQDWKTYDNKVETSLHGNKKEEVRFKSPIDYRPVQRKDGGFNVYIIIHELPDELKKARFDISCDKSRERLEGMKISGAISISDYFDFIYNNRWRVKRNWPAERDEERDCIDIQPGKENREPYTLITQVFRTLNKVAK